MHNIKFDAFEFVGGKEEDKWFSVYKNAPKTFYLDEKLNIVQEGDKFEHKVDVKLYHFGGMFDEKLKKFIPDPIY